MTCFTLLVLGFVTASTIHRVLWYRYKRRQAREQFTNVFAFINLLDCPLTDRLTHEEPMHARITYNVSGLVWEAECPSCGAYARGNTPEVAAANWNAKVGPKESKQ